MELQIQDLVSSIKKDGIESANREAAQILADRDKGRGAGGKYPQDAPRDVE